MPGPREQIDLTIHWKGGKHTELVIPRNRTGQHRRVTDRAIVDVVRDLARVQPDQHIARVLNRLGYRTGSGQHMDGAAGAESAALSPDSGL